MHVIRAGHTSAVDVLVSGSRGLIGTALVSELAASGHRPVRLIRSKASADEDSVGWDPDAGRIDARGIEGIDGVVHLAGHLIGRPWWTAGHKARVLDSRVRGTRLLAETVAGLTNPPRVFVSASAVGYYGDRGNEELPESSPSGSGFVAEVCRQWEGSTSPAASAGIRVVVTRSGIVLSKKGGALPPMLIPFRLGVGGPIGSGRQYWPWISLDDEVRAFVHLLQSGLEGPVNLVAPHSETNAEFTRELGRVLRRPTVFPVPPFLVKLVVGAEMANEMLLLSQRVVPRRLLADGFSFKHETLESALRDILDRPA
jgi:uncharacterized protein (TIGR01777 family)